MNILFITPYPQSKAPSQRFRFEQYLDLLKNKNVNIILAPFLSIKIWMNLYKNDNNIKNVTGIISGFLRRFFLLFKLLKYDFIFIHREATPLGPPWFEFIAAKIFGRKIIYDFDDAIWLSDPDERGTFKSRLKWKSKVKNICRWSYKISVGNEYLADYAKKYNSNVTIIPTVVDTENYHNPKKLKKETKEYINVGWTGTHSTLQYLEKLIPLLLKVYEIHPFKLIVISNKAPEFNFPKLEYIQWRLESEIKDLYQIDIGLMPLTDDPWSKGKCGFKVIQYMSLETPPIASAVGVNSKVIDHEKNGFLCSDEDEWKKYLLKLLQDKNLRDNIGLNARGKIIKNYSVRSTETDFLELFS